VQRRAAELPRLRDLDLGFVMPNGVRADSGAEVAYFVTESMDDLSRLVEHRESFMLAPAFMGVFGEPGDENTADADGIRHVANRLMDYHERFLTLAERCRDLQVPSKFSGLMRDCARLMDIPLDGFRVFIDFAELVGEMPELMRHGRGVVSDAIFLHMDLDDRLITRITKEVRAAAKS